jgi:beta-N-acetylhexosaminidase
MKYANSLTKEAEPIQRESSAAKVEKKISLDERAAAITAKMTDEQKAGQMLFVGIGGTELDDEAEDLIKYCLPSGIVLFDRNMKTSEQTKKLTQNLQSLNASVQAAKLFIAIDEEGGAATRMTDYLTAMPSAAELGKGSSFAAADCAVKTARELKSLGINVNFAPVADLSLAKGRAYSKNPEMAASFVQAVCRAYNRENLLCTVKHFPGIGKAKADLHNEPLEIGTARTILEKEDLVPFAAAINNVDNDAFMMMVSHLKYKTLDKTYPASVSEKIMTGLLRDELKFKGLVITDDMEMASLSDLFSFDKAACMALKAGADIVLVCHEYSHMKEAYDGILQAIKDGRLSEPVVDEKVRRIVKAKLKHLGDMDNENI